MVWKMKGNWSTLGRTSAERKQKHCLGSVFRGDTGKSRDPVVSIECHMSPAPLSCPKNQADKSVADLTQSTRGGMENLLVWRQARSALYRVCL